MLDGPIGPFYKQSIKMCLKCIKRNLTSSQFLKFTKQVTEITVHPLPNDRLCILEVQFFVVKMLQYSRWAD